MASVRPLRAIAMPVTAATVVGDGRTPRPLPPEPPPPPRPMAVAKAKPPLGPGSLDGGWDKRLARGLVAPDSVVDLHGHGLASAHATLDRGIEQALARDVRLLLLVTGNPPRAGSERPHARGAIRAAVVDWLAASRHADAIAAIRGAHPRHGGQGALYLVLRRRRAR